MPVRHSLPGTARIKPVEQGDLSRLCGLYSVINGIQLALYPHVLTHSELQDLYLCGIRHLARTRRINRVLGRGMSDEIWLQLGQQLAQDTNAAHGTSLKLIAILTGAARKNRVRAFDRIRETITKRAPVLVYLEGFLDHYTVVSGYTEQRLLLFDSSGFRSVVGNSIGLGEGSACRHWLSPRSVFALIDDW